MKIPLWHWLSGYIFKKSAFRINALWNWSNAWGLVGKRGGWFFFLILHLRKMTNHWAHPWGHQQKYLLLPVFQDFLLYLLALLESIVYGNIPKRETSQRMNAPSESMHPASQCTQRVNAPSESMHLLRQCTQPVNAPSKWMHLVSQYTKQVNAPSESMHQMSQCT